ncbi:MAG TPA: Ig-like domain-containing protein, partial [Chitinophagaceae bacterium]
VTSIAGTSTDKKVYSTREQVNISVNTNDTTRRAVPANLSLAVVPVDSFNASDAADIRSYFWMSADLKGYIESPSYYFGTPSPELETATENLMLTHGWRRFNWKRILNPSVTSNRFPVEAGTQEIKVKVTGKRNNQPASGQQVFLSVPGSDFSFSTALTDEEGIATFHIKEVFGSRQLVFQTDNSDEDYRFELVNEFHPPTAEAIPAFRFDANTGLLEKYSINMQVQNIYSADSMRIFYEHRSTDTIPFYGRGIQYNLDAYTRFTTMEEVIREYVREVNVVSRNGKLYMRILDEPRKEFNEDDLLVLWDGVPLKDPHQVFNMDPLKVKKLEVVPGRFAAGAAFFKGIASFSTYQGDLAGYSLPKAVSATEFEGLQLQREFYSPSYPDAAAKDRRIPDFRNTLFWVPDVNTGHQGNTALQFYTSDRTGKYLVVLQGLDADGNPLVSYFSFEVK